MRTDSRTNRQTDKKTSIETNEKESVQETNKQTNKQTNKKTNKHTKPRIFQPRNEKYKSVKETNTFKKVNELKKRDSMEELIKYANSIVCYFTPGRPMG